MRFGIRGKLAVGSAGVVLLVTTIIFWVAREDLDSRTVRETEHRLRTVAILAAERASDWWTADGRDVAWPQLAETVAEAGGERVTIIRRDGLVLADSWAIGTAMRVMENHAARPEIRAALEGRVGVERRHSATTGRDSLYVAVPIRERTERRVVGALRLALNLSVIDREIASLRQVLTLAAMAAFALSIAMSSVLAIVWSREARVLTRTARQMADGHLDARIPPLGDVELRELGGALAQLAASLSRTLSELRLSGDRMEGILGGMQEGVLAVDHEQQVVLLNPAFRRMLREHAGPYDPFDGVPHHPRIDALFSEVRETGEPQSAELEIGELDRRILLARVAPLAGERGGAFGVFFDATDIRRLESMRREFVANVSHELRTPITSIRSAAETLEGGAIADAEAAPAFVGIIARNAARLSNLVDDVLDLARIEAQRVKLADEPIPLGRVVEQVVALFQERVAKKQMTLSVEMEEACAWVKGDRRAIEQVLTNLVDNAIKYSGLGALVVVRAVARHPEGTIEIAVEDTGPGIAEKHLPRIFERFYRVDTGRSRELGGTGLGLAIVKHLVESMGSNIRVSSHLNVGTRFWFSLPQCLPARCDESSSPVSSPPVS